MKKLVIYILCMVFLFLIFPILFTKKNTVNNQEITNKDEEKIYNYESLRKVKVLHVDTGKVEEMDLEDYLLGVVSAEMPANFELEALKAQAVVARTYTVYKLLKGSKHENANICDDSSCCQAWISKEDRLSKWNEEERNNNWAKIEEAVNSTKGKIITYDGKPINAFFHSNSGGITDTVSNVWGGENLPYLQAITTSGEDSYTQYSSEVLLSKEEFVYKIKEYHSDFEIDWNKEDQIKILEYTDGMRVKAIQIGNLSLSGVEIRNIFGLKSAKFEINIEGDNIRFNVIRLWTWSWNEPNRCR